MEDDMRISNCTISLIIEETCTAIYQALSRPYLQLPRTANGWRYIAFDCYRKCDRWEACADIEAAKVWIPLL
uniref:Uncharacterized protein n=1 Tax=Ditylenchus dipsaci TaxID=166011 RepID=A0A915DE68_9BILA